MCTGGDAPGSFSCVCCAQCVCALHHCAAFVACVSPQVTVPFSLLPGMRRRNQFPHRTKVSPSSSACRLCSVTDVGLHHRRRILSKVCCGEHMFPVLHPIYLCLVGIKTSSKSLGILSMKHGRTAASSSSFYNTSPHREIITR